MIIAVYPAKIKGNVSRLENLVLRARSDQSAERTNIGNRHIESFSFCALRLASWGQAMDIVTGCTLDCSDTCSLLITPRADGSIRIKG
ncbi:MAG: hypothetical protein PVH08_12965, partial [Syntrophobacterales bacterium]